MRLPKTPLVAGNRKLFRNGLVGSYNDRNPVTAALYSRYGDNAKIFRSNRLARIAASLGVHSRPYQPEARGKINVFSDRYESNS